MGIEETRTEADDGAVLRNIYSGIDHWIPDKAPKRLSALLLDAFGAGA
ncbi:MAG: hypothetical protein JRS35_05755 [Deltaproteobacteria bacterium]|nr:hypothetical protein [Deltaproteobacteria bacterium]